MNMRTLYLLVAVLLPLCTWAQSSATLSGYLSDAESGEILRYATIFVKGKSLGARSNEYGFYSFQVPTGTPLEVIYSYVGYYKVDTTFSLSTDTRLDVMLSAEDNLVEEVEIVANRAKEDLSSTRMSSVTMPIEQVKRLPSIGGEVDIMKVVQLLPGVSKGGEGGTGLFVRGGDADQNLVMLDEATVYNVGHLFGFFSVFNPDAISDMTLIKGGFPAQYGGRLSSVLDIRMKEGNKEKFHGQGGIGLLSSRLTIEGPIIKDKASFLIAGRRTYIDQVFSLANIDLPYYFYDLNAKVNFTLSDKDRIFVSSYFGDDVLAFDASDISVEDDSLQSAGLGFGFGLGNFTQTIRWNHIYSSRLFSNISLIHTSFRYDISGRFLNNSILVESSIRDLGAKLDYSWYEGDHLTVRYGLHVINHRFRPNILSTQGDISELVNSREGEIQSTLEIAGYGNVEYVVSPKLKVSGGFRLSGAFVENRAYVGPEPRLASTFRISEFQALKASYSRMYQYMHLVSSSTVALPTDLWYPVSERVKPQSSDQVAIGYEQYWEKPDLQLVVEAYYKWMRNLIEYREGSNLILNDNFEDLLLQGDGHAYGGEVLLRRNQGRINGWIAYTLSFARRQFEELNEGRPFWARYDRRHVLSLVANWELTERIALAGIWEYSSGPRFTPIVAQYFFPNAALSDIELIPLYTERNAIRLSASHRLDLNIVIKNKPHKRFRTEWYIGGYNIYNRAAPYRINVRVDEQTGELIYEQPGLFGFIPSIAYNFSF